MSILLKLFKRSLDTFGDRIPHIFIKNYGRSDDFDAFDEDTDMQKRVKKYGVKVIDFPKFLGTKARNHIDDNNLTFGQAREYEGFDMIQQSRIKSFLRKAYRGFEQTGYLKTE